MKQIFSTHDIKMTSQGRVLMDINNIIVKQHEIILKHKILLEMLKEKYPLIFKDVSADNFLKQQLKNNEDIARQFKNFVEKLEHFSDINYSVRFKSKLSEATIRKEVEVLLENNKDLNEIVEKFKLEFNSYIYNLYNDKLKELSKIWKDNCFKLFGEEIHRNNNELADQINEKLLVPIARPSKR